MIFFLLSSPLASRFFLFFALFAVLRHKKEKKKYEVKVEPPSHIPVFSEEEDVSKSINTSPLLPYSLKKEQVEAIESLSDQITSVNNNIYIGGRFVAESESKNIHNYMHTSYIKHQSQACPLCEFNSEREVKDLDVYIFNDKAMDELKTIDSYGNWKVDWTKFKMKGRVSIYITD